MWFFIYHKNDDMPILSYPYKSKSVAISVAEELNCEEYETSGFFYVNDENAAMLLLQIKKG